LVAAKPHAGNTIRSVIAGGAGCWPSSQKAKPELLLDTVSNEAKKMNKPHRMAGLHLSTAA
jgi:hypothetical protein